MSTEPVRGNDGVFSVDWYKNFAPWLAWREWYHEEFGKTSFPQHQTTLSAWPPVSGVGAENVRTWLKQTRLDIDAEPKRHAGRACKTVPEHVTPWHQWDLSLVRHVEEEEFARRAAWGTSFGLAPGAVRPDGTTPPGNYYPWRISFKMKFAPPAPILRNMSEIISFHTHR